MLNIGSNEIKKIYFSSQEVQKIYGGSLLIPTQSTTTTTTTAAPTTTTTTTAAPTTTTTSTTTTTAAPFSPMAVMLTTGSSYTVPTGATTMKAWAIGSGGNYEKGAGGTAYKTWNVNGGSSVAYTVGAAVNNANYGSFGNNTTITYDNTTITGCGGGRLISGFGFNGGDGGANGGGGGYQGGGEYANGAVGGNTPQGVGRPVFKATDIDGLFAVLNLLGIDPTTYVNYNYDMTNPNVFGAGTKFDKYGSFASGGIGGGNGFGTVETRETGAVILYFT
jgi:hypothetical protein